MVTAFSEKFGFTEADLPCVILPFCVEVAELAHNYTLKVAILLLSSRINHKILNDTGASLPKI